MFTEALQGLGLTVTQTTRFDPQRIRARAAVWLDAVVNQMIPQARTMMEQSGFSIDENLGEREKYRQAAINAIPYNTLMTKVQAAVVNWSSAAVMPKMKKQGMAAMMATMYISLLNPFVGIGKMVFGMFGKKKKPKMKMPWNTMYAQALPYAQEATVQEELQRIASEVQQIAKIKQETGEKRSVEASLFKMPEGILSISKGGALVIAPVGQPIIRKL
jgi:hypothetical protein